jgi:hypothetical protein
MAAFKPTASTAIPPRDWKFWLMIVLSVVWFALMAYLMVKSANAPTIGQWWKTQSALEQSMGQKAALSPAPRVSPPAQLSGSKIPYDKVGDYYQLSFDALSGFPSEAPNLSSARMNPNPGDKKPRSKVPESILALNGQKISVAGFMIPLMVEKNDVFSFILAQSRMTCCYGVVPKLNQWIYVKMDRGKKTEWMMDIPITVQGTLDVGAQFDEENKGWCLYRMTSDNVVLPKKSWF